MSIEEITRRLDDRFSVLSDPTSRRPERRRALKATIQWSYELLFPDDQRGLWALATFAGGAPLPAVESVLEALDVPASAAIDVVGRLASRSLVIVDDEAAVRYRLLDSIRAFALEAMTQSGLTERALAAHAAWFADAAASLHRRACAAAARPSTSPSPAPSAPTSTPPWPGARRTTRCSRSASSTGSAGPGSSSATAEARSGSWRRSTPPARRPRSATGPAPCCSRRGSRRRRTTSSSLASTSPRPRELADAIDDVDLQARCCYYLAYVVSHHGEFGQAMELTDRSSALYDGLDRPWDQAANWLFAARAAISAGDRVRAVEARDQVEHWLRTVDDPWLHVRRDAMLGELARIEHRFDDAVLHIGRAAETSGRLGFLQTEAYQLSSLGRAQCQAGDYATGAATLELAIEKAEATGDVRLAALARVHLGRVLRALGRTAPARAALEAATAWHRAAGGGEQAALGECLLAALDAEDRVAGAEQRLVAILDEARRDDDAPVEVFALDALARIAAERATSPRRASLCEAADRRMEAASHFITELDRTDARAVRQIA